jgi:hypothetical protein
MCTHKQTLIMKLFKIGIVLTGLMARFKFKLVEVLVQAQNIKTNFKWLLVLAKTWHLSQMPNVRHRQATSLKTSTIFLLKKKLSSNTSPSILTLKQEIFKISRHILSFLLLAAKPKWETTFFSKMIILLTKTGSGTRLTIMVSKHTAL